MGYGEKGLTLDIKKSELRCEKCDNLLEHSEYNGTKIVYCISRKHLYICIKCAMKPMKNAKKRVTLDELDAFLQKKLGEVFIK